MCRLFAYVAPDSSAVDRELGDAGMEGFLSLARLHGDGWGWAGVDHPGATPTVRKSMRSAATDPGFRDALALDGRAGMVHLRWATIGLAIDTRNTHPFSADGVSFEHNGSLKPLDVVRGMLAPETLAGLTGDTDSEMYFALIRERLATGATVGQATLDAARRLRSAYPTCSLNALLLDAEQLVVVHASARSRLDEDDLDEIHQFDLPNEHTEDYFALRWTRKADGTLLVGSTGVAGSDWDALPAESVTTVRLADGVATSTRLFADDRAGAELLLVD